MLPVLILAIAFCLAAAALLWGRPLLRLYALEPVGAGIPVFTAVLILITPQMADMMAAISGGRGIGGGYDEARWHQAGFGLATAFLGFQGWFWMRAALNARFNVRDARPPGQMQWPERWAPRLVLLPALLIALSPLLVAATGRIAWASVPLPGVAVALLSTGLLLLFIWRRRSVFPPLGSYRPLPRLRCARLIAAAPLHRGVAFVSLGCGVSGFVLPLLWPDQVNDALHTAAAALLGAGCLIPLAALLLAALRDLIDLPLRRLRPLHRRNASFAGPVSDTMGVLLLLLTPILGGWASEQVELYNVSRADQPLRQRPTVAEAADAFAGCGAPVIAVIEGGASRSAAWGLSMMAALDESTGDRFSRHLFAISSVSGGSLAAATYALVRGQADTLGKPVWHDAQAGLVELARADLLSSSVFRMLTIDALLGVPTRGWSLAHAFEHFWAWDQGFDIPKIQHGAPLFLDVRTNRPCSPISCSMAPTRRPAAGSSPRRSTSMAAASFPTAWTRLRRAAPTCRWPMRC